MIHVLLPWLLAGCEADPPVDSDIPTPEPCVDAIVTDIDETLTIADAEFLTQLDDPTYDPIERPDASTLMQGYADLGFTVIYVSTRGRNMDMGDGSTATEATDAWLTAHGFPRSEGDTFLSRGNNFAGGENAVNLKADAVDDLEAMGWRFAFAYGNAATDIEAFQQAGIPDDQIFHVGRLAGTIDGVDTISDDDAYTAHLPHLDTVEPSCP